MVPWQQVLDFIDEFAGVIAVGAALFGICAFLMVLVARSTLRALTRPLRSMGHSSAELNLAIPAIAKVVENNQLRIEGVTRGLDELREKSRRFFQHTGLVRYDAFEDVGGQQSYSLCLLDGDKNGILLTYLTGRNSTRSYTVSVKSGVPSRKLSDEETRALDEALSDGASR
jgi:hypothetical protein